MKVSDDTGSSSVEFALLFPVLVLVIGGLLEFGRVIAAQQATRDIIDGAVRDGVVQVLSATTVQDTIDAGLANVGTVQNYTIDVTDGTYLAVTVTATYNMIFAGLVPQDLITFQMTSTLHR